jgi:hypothetical protein
MVETAALLVEEVLPRKPLRQWVLSLPFALRFLLATRPDVLTQVLGIVYRAIAADLRLRARRSRAEAETGAVTLIQRFGSALNLNIHFHMLFLDGVYVKGRRGSSSSGSRLQAPSAAELQALVGRIAARVGRALERGGLLVRDAETSYLALEEKDGTALDDLLGHSISYRIAVGPRTGEKVFTLSRLPAREECERGDAAECSGFSLHAGVAVEGGERARLERLARYITRPAVAEERLALTESGQVRYQLKTAYRDGTTCVVFEPTDFSAAAGANARLPLLHIELRLPWPPSASRSAAAAQDALWRTAGEGPAYRQPQQSILRERLSQRARPVR